MHPIIFSIGPITIYSYGLMFALASLVSLILVSIEGKKKGIEPKIFYDLYFWILLSSLVGARLLHILINLSFYLKRPVEILMVHRGGLAWFGGAIFGILAAFFIAKKRRIPFLVLADIFAPYLALAQGIGRIGCFLNGCCFGKPTNSIFGIIFPKEPQPLHPTQLYSAFALFLICGILIFIKRYKPIFPGALFCFYMLLSGIARFIIEFFRADTIASPIFNLTLFQIFSFLWIISAIVIFLTIKKPLVH